MSWNLDSQRPIFLQIIEKIRMDIISGIYQPGERLPSVRELAQIASVNPNTMQKALSELEHTGLIYSQRTSGRFITDDISLIQSLKMELASQMIDGFLIQIHQLGFQEEQILSLIDSKLKGEKQ